MEELPEKYRHDLLIIQETAEQITRDINLDGFNIHFSGNPKTAFPELMNQLLPLVSKIFNTDKVFFQKLLYRVDIPEKEYKKVLSKSDHEGIDEALTALIIRRAFQKVLTRNYFKFKTDNQ